MKRKKEKMFLRSCSFSETLYEFIENIADKENVSFSEVVRYAVNEYRIKLRGDDD